MKVAVWATERVVGCKWALLAGVLFWFTGVAAAQTQTPVGMAEQRAKSVTQVVLGILSYARWPVEPAQLRLCIVGPTEYTDDLVKGTTQATGRPVIVRRLLADNPALVSECDAVYIGKLTTDERSRLFASLIGHPVLSISEGGDQCTVGSLFCLRVGDEQVSFEVNLDSVARSGVRIHPSVLQLSRRKPAVP
ncbi:MULTISPECIES: YfiR family protein [unclassified Pseudomonas]|uniref:YfiR family protein n=1 Tax=unclassified Pseudomonas TaxID=196821 RepID=UPI000A1DBD96|nr:MULTISPECIES: YfiR family protein [unclassified Pseudomonas]MCX4221235.1 YfiR family protein [Pseudomonas sp. MCal1]UDI93639.1 YfiR family protein [Pseudomonas sp. IAC-BECa141]